MSKAISSVWFPSLEKLESRKRESKKEKEGSQHDAPRMKVVCFPCSGAEESMYTGEGTGSRRFNNDLIEFCFSDDAQLLALQYPGRGLRRNDPLISCIKELACECL